MEEPHLEDFIGHRLKEIYNNSDDERFLTLEFDNNYKLLIKGVGQPAFLVKKERIDLESKEEREKKETVKKKAISERKTKESKQKNRSKKKG